MNHIARLFAALLCLTCACSRVPTDQELVAMFHDHRGELDALILLYLERKGIDTGDLGLRPAFGSSEPQPTENDLMKRLNLRSLYSPGPWKVELTVACEGTFSNWCRGFYFDIDGRGVDAARVVESLDDSAGTDHMYFRHLEGRWYGFKSFRNL